MRRTVRCLPLIAASMLIAACGPSVTSPPSQGAAATEPSATETPFTLPPAPSFSFALPSADKALEALLPNEVAGAPIVKSSISGPTLAGSGPGSEDMRAMLTRLGKTPDDLSAAFGSGGGLIMSAYRLKGVDATALLAAFAVLLDADEAPTMTDASLGGKSVTKVVTGVSTVYAYTKDDVLFTVTGGTGVPEATIAEAISKLP